MIQPDMPAEAKPPRQKITKVQAAAKLEHVMASPQDNEADHDDRPTDESPQPMKADANLNEKREAE